LFKLYAKLDPDERKVANKDLFEAIREGDETFRYDALAITSEFKLADAMTHLNELSIRLQMDNSPGAPFELEWVQRIIKKLRTST